jgi:8-oxo-dGTP diphosphatase
MLYLVRHAKAGNRSAWTDPDELRPLSASGWTQAQSLAERLAPLCSGTLISSPYVRCVQTLEPLATMLDTVVATDDRLAEGLDCSGALDLLASVADGAALCSHGDIIPDTIAALQRRGCTFLTEPDWRKASVWVLRRSRKGDIIEAEAWAPPDR